jgi:hypothetical protein
MRYWLNDYEWRVIKPMLPNKPRGVPRVDANELAPRKPTLDRPGTKPELLTLLARWRLASGRAATGFLEMRNKRWFIGAILTRQETALSSSVDSDISQRCPYLMEQYRVASNSNISDAGGCHGFA